MAEDVYAGLGMVVRKVSVGRLWWEGFGRKILLLTPTVSY